jgi:hypothetical protein
MATFQSRPGFKPVKHSTGAPYNGQANIYSVGAAVTLVPGDVVILAADGTANGLPQVTIGTATGTPVGVVVGVINSKIDPVSGKMTSGSISLDTPQTAGQNALVLVADAPDLICETEIATYNTARVGENLELVPTTYNTTTGASNMKVVLNGNTQTDPFRLIGRVLKDDLTSTGYATPVDGDSNVKVLVSFNIHEYKAATGTAGA